MRIAYTRLHCPSVGSRQMVLEAIVYDFGGRGLKLL